MKILYQDEDLLVVDKPSGLVVHRGWAREDVTAMDLARELCGTYVHPVHRLDRATSGALVFALNAEAAKAMNKAFEEHAVAKTYALIARGYFPEVIDVDHAVPRGESNVRGETPELVPAFTSFRCVSRIEGASFVLASPTTGRLHQIRRHARHLSHPILGDTTYGDGKRNREWREKGLTRLALHAHSIAFAHPRTREQMCVVAPLAEDLARVCERVGLSVAFRLETPATRV